MPRPPKCRRVQGSPAAAVFKPAGVPRCDLQEVTLTLDEFEAVRLADLQGEYQEDAAGAMGVSRQTFGNILAEAHRKIADCLVHGKALKIEGGNIELDMRIFFCGACKREWPEPFGTGRPERCPHCGSEDIDRDSMNQGMGCIHSKRNNHGGT
jgi:uncharacterized protein